MKLTQEQLAALIAKVFAGIDAKRKACKEAGQEVPDGISVEEIMEEVNAVLSEGEAEKADEPAEGGVSAGEGMDAETAALVSKIMEAINGAKSGDAPEEKKGAPEPAPAASTGAPEKKSGGPSVIPEAPVAAPAAAPATPQRKYVNLFLNTGAASRDGAQATGFKARLDAMSAPERRKAAYGMFGRAVKCINTSGGDVERAAYTAEHKFNDSEMSREFKALAATSPTDGGYLVPEVYSKEIIELLYPTTIIYALGARRLGMTNGNMNIPKIKTGSRAMFTGENRAIPKTQPKFGNLKLSAKKLTALVPMSNDLLRSTSFDNDVIVGQDITKQMALGVDWGALMGTGGEFQPLGILSNKKVQMIDVTSIGTEYSTADGKLTAAFPAYIVAAVLKNNVYADGLGFAFNTSVEQYFKSLRDQVGGFIFADEMTKNHTLMGHPYKTTNLIETVGGKTSIIFGNWNDLVIGEQGALEIETSREGTWTDDAGNIVSAFENDQTLIRAINHVDTGLRHEESFAVAQKVAVPV